MKHGVGKGPKCDECGSRLSRPLDLNDHMRSFHGAPQLQCEVLGCDVTFKSFNGRLKHMKNKHSAS